MIKSLKQLDEDLFLWLNNLGTERWDGFWMIVTDQWMSIPIYVLLSLLILWKTGFRSAVVIGFMILALVGVTLVVSRLFKYGFLRPITCTMDLDFRYNLSEDYGEYGFFTSHSSVSIALIVFM